jgi:hypothetical protein
MVEVNWQAIGGALLIAAGGGWSAWQWWSGSRNANPPEARRAADEHPPLGAVEWVEDIRMAMGGASAESVLQCLTEGATRDTARRARIEELEATKSSKATK